MYMAAEGKACLAHAPSDGVSSFAANLRTGLLQSIAECIERDLQKSDAILCPRAVAHVADINKIPDSSCHEGYYTTAQIVANLLHLVVQLTAFPKPICTAEQGVQCGPKHADSVVQTEPGMDAETQTLNSSADIEVQTHRHDFLTAGDLADAEVQALVPLATHHRATQSLALCRICNENLAIGEGLSAMACAQCQATYQIMCRRCDINPVLSKGSICHPCHLKLSEDFEAARSSLAAAQEEAQALQEELDAATETGIATVNQDGRRVSLLVQNKEAKEKKILSMWKDYHRTSEAIKEETDDASDSTFTCYNCNANEVSSLGDMCTACESALTEQAVSDKDDRRPSSYIASDIDLSSVVAPPEDIDLSPALKEAIAARDSVQVEFQATCRSCHKNKVALKGLQCLQCQNAPKCSRCRSSQVLNQGDICKKCSGQVIQHIVESKDLQAPVTMRDAAVQSVIMTSDAELEAIVPCHICRINSVLTYGSPCADCVGITTIIKKRPRSSRLTLENIRGTGVCARCAAMPVSCPGEVCDHCMSKAPWRGVRIGGGYDVLKFADPTEQVQETVRADAANRLDSSYGYSHGAPATHSSPDRFRVGSYTHRSPRQTITGPREANAQLPAARRGGRQHIAVDAAALVRASLSAMTHTISGGGTPGPPGAPVGEGEPNLYRVMVPVKEPRPSSAPGTARIKSFT